MRRIAIIGGTGFVGARLAARREAVGQEVHVLARPGSSTWRLEALGAAPTVHRVASADVGAYAEALAAIRPHEIIHLAAQTRRAREGDLSDAASSAKEDLANLLAAVAAAASLRPAPEVLLRGGSLAEYGPVASPPHEGRREAPADPYAAAAVAGTHYLQMLQPRLPFPAMTARFGLVYGPLQSDRFFVAELIDRIVEGMPMTIRRPLDLRDAIFVDDALDALDVLAAAPLGGGVVNIGSGRAVSTAWIAAVAIEAAGGDPAWLSFAQQAPTDARHLMLDCSLARRSWGWSARTRLRDGLSLTAERQRALRAECKPEERVRAAQ